MPPSVGPQHRNVPRGSSKGQGMNILVTPVNSSFASRSSGGNMSRERGNSSLSRSSSVSSLGRTTSSPRSNSIGGGFGSSSNRNILGSSSSGSPSLKSSTLTSSQDKDKENIGREPRIPGLLGSQLATQLEKVFQRLATLEDQYKTTSAELDSAKVCALVLFTS